MPIRNMLWRKLVQPVPFLSNKTKCCLMSVLSNPDRFKHYAESVGLPWLMNAPIKFCSKWNLMR